MRGLVLFGYYPALPEPFRKQGSQPGFAYGHAMAALNGSLPASALPPFFREDKLETGPITGCTETSAAMVAAWATGIPAIAQPATRETLQSAMGAQDTGVTPSQLQGGITKVLHITTQLGATWPLILDALGPVAWVADPLGYRWTRVTTTDLQGFCAGHARIISPYQTVIFTRTESPDTGTGEDMLVVATVEPFVAPVHRPIGPSELVYGYDPAVQGKPVDQYKNPLTDRGTSVLVDAYVTVTYPGNAKPPIPHGRFLRVSEGGGLEGRLVVQPTYGELNPTPITQPTATGGHSDQDVRDAELAGEKAGANKAAQAVAQAAAAEAAKYPA